MEKCVLVRTDDAILSIPVADLNDPKLFRWWMQPCPPSSENFTHAYAKAAWIRYSALTGQSMDTHNVLKRSKRQLWLRTKLTQWGII